MDEVFAETSVFINDDERIIVREPEYLDGLMSVLKDTPQKVVGTYMKESTHSGTFDQNSFRSTIHPPLGMACHGRDLKRSKNSK